MDDVLRILAIGGSQAERELYQQLMIHFYEQDYDLYTIETADNAEQIIAQFQPDCILLDHGCASAQCMQQLTANEKSSPTPIVVITESIHNFPELNDCLLKTEITAEKLHGAITQAISHVDDYGYSVIEYFSGQLSEHEQQNVQLAQALEGALEHSELFLRYQPIIDLLSDKPIGIETLMRWEHPSIDIIGPKHFLPLAERTGLIVPMGEWLLERACQDLKVWQRDALIQQNLYIKVTPRQLEEGEYIDVIMDTLVRNAVSPHHLVLEIKDDVFANHQRHHRYVLDELVELGVRLVIQDVNIKRSNYDYFSLYPFDAIKLPRRIMQQIGLDLATEKQVSDIVSHAKSINAGVIATGIETQQQLQRLYELGCYYGQGYLLCLPLKAQAMANFLATTTTSMMSRVKRRC